MVATTIALQRLYQQRLSHNPLSTPEAVVEWLGAVQAQDYPGGKWALGLRMSQATDTRIDQAFNAGRILRTHIMRPTWHFVTPSDIRWIMELTAPRVKAKFAYQDRQCEIDAALISRTNHVIADALQGGRQLTRQELGSALAAAGIAAKGLRLACLVSHAELDAVVCSGAQRGKQFTYALLDERAPQAKRLQRDEALAELTRRYYTGHGPATLHDFAWWSGLTVADAKAGVALAAAHLSHTVIDEQTYWFPVAMPAAAEPSQAAYLLPTYDEFFVGYSAFDKERKGGQADSQKFVFESTIVLNGQVVGSWKCSFKQGKVIIETAPFHPFTATEQAAVDAAQQRVGGFLQLPTE
jgi:Winged helix DNA-binding domain